MKQQQTVPQIYEAYCTWCQSIGVKPAGIQTYCEVNYSDPREQEQVLDGGC